MTEKIRTKDIVQWLRSLPPDRPFCTDDRCPVAEFAWRERMRLVNNMEANEMNPIIAFISDDITCGSKYERIGERGRWGRVTPRQILNSRITRCEYEDILLHDVSAEPRLLTCITQS